MESVTLDFSETNNSQPQRNDGAVEFAGHLQDPAKMSEGIDKSLYVEANRLATFKNWPVRKDYY